MKLSVAFLLALFAYLFSSAVFPSLKWLTFTPFLALLYQKSSFLKSIWLSLLCGLITDLFTFQTSFGWGALSYAIVTLVLYRKKQHFYQDNSFSLILYTALISLLLSGVQLFVIRPFDKGSEISLHWIICDLIFMAIFDAFYAFIWFICPQKIYLSIKVIDWKRLRSYR